MSQNYAYRPALFSNTGPKVRKLTNEKKLDVVIGNEIVLDIPLQINDYLVNILSFE